MTMFAGKSASPCYLGRWLLSGGISGVTACLFAFSNRLADVSPCLRHTLFRSSDISGHPIDRRSVGGRLAVAGGPGTDANRAGKLRRRHFSFGRTEP